MSKDLWQMLTQLWISSNPRYFIYFKILENDLLITEHIKKHFIRICLIRKCLPIQVIPEMVQMTSSIAAAVSSGPAGRSTFISIYISAGMDTPVRHAISVERTLTEYNLSFPIFFYWPFFKKMLVGWTFFITFVSALKIEKMLTRHQLFASLQILQFRITSTPISVKTFA